MGCARYSAMAAALMTTSRRFEDGDHSRRYQRPAGHLPSRRATRTRIAGAKSPVTTEIAYEAGLRWQRYRQAGGPRERIITDFLIGAHALGAADKFLTRDRSFYTTYFPELSAE